MLDRVDVRRRSAIIWSECPGVGPKRSQALCSHQTPVPNEYSSGNKLTLSVYLAYSSEWSAGGAKNPMLVYAHNLLLGSRYCMG